MCGRIDVNGEEINGHVQEQMGIAFNAQTNRDLRPSQQVSTVTVIDGQLQQLDTRWGIKPAWANSLLINAKAETVTEKQTFTKAFAFGRCLVPCSGFYEWMPTKKGKVKIRFCHNDHGALYMGAFWYPGEYPELVTLTTEAPMEYRTIHHRFPVFIDPESAHEWLTMHPVEAQAMTTKWGRKQITMERTD